MHKSKNRKQELNHLPTTSKYTTSMATTSIKPELENVINQVEETPIAAIKEAITEAVEKSEEIIQEAKVEEKPKAKKKLPKKPKAKAEAKDDKKSSTKKDKAIKDAAKQQKAALVEEVVSNREVKWLYPEDCKDTLARKSFRQKNRNKIRAMERKLYRIEDQNSKEYKDALKKLNDFRKKVLKPNQVV